MLSRILFHKPSSQLRHFLLTWRSLLFAFSLSPLFSQHWDGVVDGQPSTQSSASFTSFCQEHPHAADSAISRVLPPSLLVWEFNLTFFEHYQRAGPLLWYVAMRLDKDDTAGLAGMAIIILPWFHGKKAVPLYVLRSSRWHILTRNPRRSSFLREANYQLCWNPSSQKMILQYTPSPREPGNLISGRVRSELVKLEEDDWATVALDVPKHEARFLTKLDLTLISASALGVMIRYLDQVNITNAFSMLSSHKTSASVSDNGCRQWDERRSFTLWERTQLCQCYLECSLCDWPDSFKSDSYSSQRPSLHCFYGGCLDRFHICSCWHS